ncbi:hypothetical protein V8C40DRAFT_261529 [Trichoderma camerunense]
MEIYETSEAFIEKDDDLVFDHTKIILKGADDEFFYAKTNSREHQISQIDVNNLDISRIPADHVWPFADPNFTRAPDPLPSTSYLKRPWEPFVLRRYTRHFRVQPSNTERN